MNGLKRKFATAAAILAAGGVIAAHAADAQVEATPGYQASATQPIQSMHAFNSARAPETKAQHARFEWFENQMSLASAPSYTPSEHPNARPAPKSAHSTPSVWDDPVNTASPGQ
jgi:hypothetical protein